MTADPLASLRGKVALITGAGSGIGRETALAFGRAGSRVVESSRPTMGAIFLIVVVLAVASLALIWVLNTASAAHDRLTGRKAQVRQHVPWLRSMRAERVEHERDRRQVTALERVLVITVVAAVLLFEVWFFFFSGSPIGAN